MTDTKIPQDVIDDAKAAGFLITDNGTIFRSAESSTAKLLVKFAALRDQRQAVPELGIEDIHQIVPEDYTFEELNAWESGYNYARKNAAPTPPSSNAEGVEPSHKYAVVISLPDGDKTAYVDDLEFGKAIVDAFIPDTPPAADAKPDGEAVAYLHTLKNADGEEDLALSFSPDNFPFSDSPELGYVSIRCDKLFPHPSNDAMRSLLEKVRDRLHKAQIFGLASEVSQALANVEGK